MSQPDSVIQAIYEPDLTELAPLVRVITAAMLETPVTLGTPAGVADLAATIAVRVAVYVGHEVLPPGPPTSRAAVLREAADIAESLRQFKRVTAARWSAQVSENLGILRVATELRRLAVEPQPATADNEEA